jgi:Tol biopolymer transport system component
LLRSFWSFEDWLPAGDRFLLGESDPNGSRDKLHVASLEVVEFSQPLSITPDEIRTAKVSPDGEHIVYDSASGIWLARIDGIGATLLVRSELYNGEIVEDPKTFAAAPSWHPSGTRVIYEGYDIQTIDRESSGGPVTSGELAFYIMDVSDRIGELR